MFQVVGGCAHLPPLLASGLVYTVFYIKLDPVSFAQGLLVWPYLIQMVEARARALALSSNVLL